MVWVLPGQKPQRHGSYLTWRNKRSNTWFSKTVTFAWPLRASWTPCFLGSCLTHICLVDRSILINWMSQFLILGVSGVLIHFYSISNRYSCWQTVKTLIRHRILRTSGLGVYCLPMSPKRDIRLIRVQNTPYYGAKQILMNRLWWNR